MRRVKRGADHAEPVAVGVAAGAGDEAHEEVARRGALLAGGEPRAADGVGAQGRRLPHSWPDHGAEMQEEVVLQIAAELVLLVQHGDAGRLERVSGTDARSHQQRG